MGVNTDARVASARITKRALIAMTHKYAKWISPVLMAGVVVSGVSAGQANASGGSYFPGEPMTITKIDSSTGKPVTGKAMDSMTLQAAACSEHGTGDHKVTTSYFSINQEDGNNNFETCDAYFTAVKEAGDDQDKLRELGVFTPKKVIPRRDGTISLRPFDMFGFINQKGESIYYPGIAFDNAYFREGTPPTGYERNTSWNHVPMGGGVEHYETDDGGDISGYVPKFSIDKFEIKDSPGTSANVETPFTTLSGYRIDKVDQSGAPVEGAKFTAKRWDANTKDYTSNEWMDLAITGFYDLDLTFTTDKSGALIVSNEKSFMKGMSLEEVLDMNYGLRLTEVSAPSGYSMPENKTVDLGLSWKKNEVYVNPTFGEAEWIGLASATGGEKALDKSGVNGMLEIVNAKDEAPASSEETAPSSQPSSSGATSPSTSSTKSSTKSSGESTSEGSSGEQSSPSAVATTSASSSVSPRPMSPISGGASTSGSEESSGPDVNTGGDVESEGLVSRIFDALKSLW